jgi:hypothetical protein
MTLSASQSRSNSDGTSRPCHLAERGRNYPVDYARSCPSAVIRAVLDGRAIVSARSIA